MITMLVNNAIYFVYKLIAVCNLLVNLRRTIADRRNSSYVTVCYDMPLYVTVCYGVICM